MEDKFWGIEENFSISESYEDYIEFASIKPIRFLNNLPNSFIRLFIFQSFGCYIFLEIDPEEMNAKCSIVDNLWYGIIRLYDEIFYELGYNEGHTKLKNGDYSGTASFEVSEYYVNERKKNRKKELKNRISESIINLKTEDINNLLKLINKNNEKKKESEYRTVRFDGETIFVESLINGKYKVIHNTEDIGYNLAIETYLIETSDLISKIKNQYYPPSFLKPSKEYNVHTAKFKEKQFLKKLLKKTIEELIISKCPTCSNSILLDLSVVDLDEDYKKVFFNFQCLVNDNHKAAIASKLKKFKLLESISNYLNYNSLDKIKIHVQDSRIIRVE